MDEILEAEHRAQVRKILESASFRTSAIHRDLFSYLAEKSLSGQADSLKEYTVGVDCLGKPAAYDPRRDSSVRMHGARLRQKLAEYYRSEGTADTVTIDLPKGGFKLVFESRTNPRPPAETLSPILPAAELRKPPIRYLIAGLCALGLAIYGWISLRSPGSPAQSLELLSPELQQIWGPLLSSERRVAVCLSVPVFASVPGFNGVVGPFPGEWEKILKSPGLNVAKDAFHTKEASPSYDYTDVGTAIGAFRMGQFLARLSTNVLITRGDLVSLPELGMDNVVYLGSPKGNPQIQAISGMRQFAVDDGGVRNLQPSPGQPEYLPDQKAEGQVGFPEAHALITLAPGPNGSGLFLYLMGNSESAILATVNTVTDPTIAHNIFSHLKRPDGKLPRYFQLVITVKSMEDMPIDISYATHKELSGVAPGAR